MKEEGVRGDLVAVVATLFATGSRIRAVLALTHQNLTADGRVIIHQGKGSAPLVCAAPPELLTWAASCTFRVALFPWTNYTAVYRLMKEYCLTLPDSFGQNTAVTASARKVVAREVFAASADIEDVAAALGHRSPRSSTYYIDAPKVSDRERAAIKERWQPYLGELVITRTGIIRRKRIK